MTREAEVTTRAVETMASGDGVGDGGADAREKVAAVQAREEASTVNDLRTGNTSRGASGDIIKAARAHKGAASRRAHAVRNRSLRSWASWSFIPRATAF